MTQNKIRHSGEIRNPGLRECLDPGLRIAGVTKKQIQCEGKP